MGVRGSPTTVYYMSVDIWCKLNLGRVEHISHASMVSKPQAYQHLLYAGQR